MLAGIYRTNLSDLGLGKRQVDNFSLFTEDQLASSQANQLPIHGKKASHILLIPMSVTAVAQWVTSVAQ
jgi:hypothetical protein